MPKTAVQLNLRGAWSRWALTYFLILCGCHCTAGTLIVNLSGG